MLTNFQNITINDHLLINGQLFSNSSNNLCKKKHQQHPMLKKNTKNLYNNIKMGEIEQVWADSTYKIVIIIIKL